MNKFAEAYRNRLVVQNFQYNKVENYIKSIPENEIESKFLEFLKWEEKFEEKQYTINYTQTESLIMQYLMVYVEHIGKKGRTNGFFESCRYKYMGYVFELHVGQGAFWRIRKGRKIIFQSK